jgi:threonine/homoserine/homoserine lactone efflux protein
VAAVFAAQRLLAADGTGRASGARARWLRRGSGLTLIGLGAYLAVAKRNA